MNKYEEAWRVAWTFIFLLFLQVVVFATAQHNHVIVYDSKESNLGELMLVAATLILTCVAIVLAVGALWGYRELKEATINAATKAAEDEARKTATKVAEIVVRRSKFSKVELEDGTSPEEALEIVAAQQQELDSKS